MKLTLGQPVLRTWLARLFPSCSDPRPTLPPEAWRELVQVHGGIVAIAELVETELLKEGMNEPV